MKINKFEEIFAQGQVEKTKQPKAKVITFTHYEQDPRPDLESDHGYWVALLRLAKMKDIDIFGILHCLRCGGAGLVRDRRTGLRIVSGEWDAAKYNEYKQKYLRPNIEAIKDLLIRASKTNVKNLSTHQEVMARVKALEPRLKAAGWTHQEIWAEEPFTSNGMRMDSVFSSLLSDPHAEITEITPEHTEFTYKYPSGHVAKSKLYKVPPYVRNQPKLTAPLKKEVV